MCYLRGGFFYFNILVIMNHLDGKSEPGEDTVRIVSDIFRALKGIVAGNRTKTTENLLGEKEYARIFHGGESIYDGNKEPVMTSDDNGEITDEDLGDVEV